ncbi:MAG: aldehyde dehydrogenase [Salinicola sp.]|uniref:thiamine pyrophosphate-dependent enzyme n=1 Tax=uncultured Salinicola sp. TaxID=1193542 RepID=UPI000C896B79|nr:thiamine pyrophosphate-dependent enzyme [uncultured Salinicola sp.]MAM55744.1 aldehyde dehydrogenase [Salinicola sp.]
MTEQTREGLDRRRFIKDLVESIPDALIVTGLGSPSYDVFAAGDRPGNFYLWGAMGGSVSMGLGLALARPDKPVVVVTGDGEMLMGIGSLGTVGVKLPPNLSIVVLDNGHYGETGMQRSHASLGTDLVAVAKGFGIAESFTVEDHAGSSEIADRINAREGTCFAQVFISAKESPRALPARDGVYIKNRFRDALGLSPI